MQGRHIPIEGDSISMGESPFCRDAYRKTDHSIKNITRLMTNNCEEQVTHQGPISPREKLHAIPKEQQIE